MVLFITTAFATDTIVTVPAAPATIDLTGISTAVIAGVFSILAVVVPLFIQSHMKDKQAAAALATAIQNSLGAIQQAAQTEVTTISPTVSIPGVPANIAVGVQYVLDHAGEEAARFGISATDLAEKISAQIGLANIKTNIATAASPAPSPKPLDAVPTPVSPSPFGRKP
jgi:hypothetical protein